MTMMGKFAGSKNEGSHPPTYGVTLTVLALLLAACSSDDGDTQALQGLNPCATEGALYKQRCIERPGGTCGVIPDTLIDTNNEAQVTGDSRCETVTEDGCNVRASGCRSSADGCTLYQTWETSFAEDGSHATVILAVDISCSDGSSCSSMYDCMIDRQ